MSLEPSTKAHLIDFPSNEATREMRAILTIGVGDLVGRQISKRRSDGRSSTGEWANFSGR